MIIIRTMVGSRFPIVIHIFWHNSNALVVQYARCSRVILRV